MMTKRRPILIGGIIGIYLITQYSSISRFPSIFEKDNSSINFSTTVKHSARASLASEDNLPIRYPWKSDINCSTYAVQFGKGLRKTYLVSYPRSGNTWLRYLIEGATGLFTSSVYSNKGLYDLGFLGELGPHGDGRTIVTKTHGISIHSSSIKNVQLKRTAFKAPAILLIRDPSRSILSYWSFLGGLNNKKASFFNNVDNSTYKTEKFHHFISTSLEKWILINTETLKTSEHIQILFYEDLLADIKKELLKILDFLQLPVDEGRLWCLLRHSEGPFKRKHEEGLYPYSEEEEIQMNFALKKVLELAQRRGYEPSSKDQKILINGEN